MDVEGPMELPVETVAWRSAPDDTNACQPRDAVVTRLAAEVIAAKALLRTLRYNRTGDFDEVKAQFDEAILRVRGLGDSDPDVARHVQALLEARESLSRYVDKRELKARYLAGTSASRSKRPDGTSRR